MESAFSMIRRRLSSLSGRASAKQAGPPHFSELSSEDIARLDRQGAVIAAEANRRYGSELRKEEKDLIVLQRLLDDEAFDKSQTYELQCLGVALGDILASAMPLRWVIITDEYGSDPTLRLQETSVNINALTMISKRLERGEKVNVSELLEKTRQAVSEAQQNGQ